MSRRLSSAVPLAGLYIALVIYASLFPFKGWTSRGISPFEFLLHPWPYYWSGLDVVINLAGYVPLGFLLTLAFSRSGWTRSAGRAGWRAVVIAAALSLTMEAVQTFLPMRVPSKLDWLLNVSGAFLGAVWAAKLERWHLLQSWDDFRRIYLRANSQNLCALLMTWPLALISPLEVPFGLGQVFNNLRGWLISIWAVFAGDVMLDDTMTMLGWLEPVSRPMSVEVWMMCITLGLLIPWMLCAVITSSIMVRGLLAAWVLLAGVLATLLSAAVSYGPQHAAVVLMTWPVLMAIAIASLLAFALLRISWRKAIGVCIVLLLLQTVLVNHASSSAYVTQHLQEWEQGRFMRFHGLAQWWAWLWPYVTLLHLLLALRRECRSA